MNRTKATKACEKLHHVEVVRNVVKAAFGLCAAGDLSGARSLACRIHFVWYTQQKAKSHKRDLFLSPSLIFLIGKNKFVKNPRTFYFSKTGHEKREIRPVSQASTLFKIFIFVQKMNFDFFVELFWVKTRGNAAVFDFLTVDNFDFTRKIVKKIFGEKCWGLSKLSFWTKIRLLE